MTDEIYLKIQNYIAGLEELRKQVQKLEDRAYTLNSEIRDTMEELEELENEEAEKRYTAHFNK
jgi:predicted  nucleic acid-binding Zn-ribbon protein